VYATILHWLEVTTPELRIDLLPAFAGYPSPLRVQRLLFYFS